MALWVFFHTPTHSNPIESGHDLIPECLFILRVFCEVSGKCPLLVTLDNDIIMICIASKLKAATTGCLLQRKWGANSTVRLSCHDHWARQLAG